MLQNPRGGAQEKEPFLVRPYRFLKYFAFSAKIEVQIKVSKWPRIKKPIYAKCF